MFLLHVLNKNENIQINAGYWVLSENRKNSSQQEKTMSQSQKLVPAKHKKSPIRKNKLPQKFRAIR